MRRMATNSLIDANSHRSAVTAAPKNQVRRGARQALQLRSPFDVGSAGFGLMCTSPDGPCDDVGGPDASLRKTNSDAPDFLNLSLIHISEPTRLGMISYAVFCLK